MPVQVLGEIAMVRIRTRSVVLCLVGIVFLWGASAKAAPKLADSVADFTGVQGQNGWTYGYFNTSDHGGVYVATPGGTDYFVQLPWYGIITNKVADENAWQFEVSANPWTFLGAGKAHPNGSDPWSGSGTNDHWAVRRYVSPVAGTLEMDWHLAKDDITYGNGVTGRVFFNGTEVDTHTIAFDDAVGIDSVVEIPGVHTGDYIDLVLDACGTDWMADGGINNGQDDLSFQTATILLIPEPGTLTLVVLGGLAALRRRTR